MVIVATQAYFSDLVRILDTQNTHYQDIRIANRKKVIENAEFIKRNEIAYLQNCNHVIIFDSEAVRWVRVR